MATTRDSSPRFEEARDLVLEVAHGWSAHRIPQQAAAMSYYFLVTLAPLTLLLFYLLTHVLGGLDPNLVTGLMESLSVDVDTFPDIIGVAERYAAEIGSFGPIVAAGIALAGGTVLLGQFTGTLDVIWDSKPDGSGISYFIRKRLLALAGVLTMLAAVVLASVALNLWNLTVGHLRELTGASLALPTALGAIVDAGEPILAAVVALLLSFAYTWLPHRRIRWRDTLAGASITAVLYMVGQVLLFMYVTRSSLVSAFGIAGSIIAVVVWIYYTMQVVLGGAELTRVLVLRREGTRAVVSDPGGSTVDQQG